jgi:hypothetical protein
MTAKERAVAELLIKKLREDGTDIDKLLGGSVAKTGKKR